MSAPAWQWWHAAEGDVWIADVINGLREQIDKDASTRRQDLVAMRSIYLDKPCDYYEGWSYHRTKRSRYNLTQGAVDSTHAQIVASRPRPKIVTVGADDTAARRAELRQRWIDGEYERLGAYELLSEMVLDGLIYGTGVLKVSPDDGRPTVERVWCGDLWVDPREERYLKSKVRTLYQLHEVDRDVLMLEYPEHAAKIPLATADRTSYDFPDLARGSDDGGYRNLVPLLEAWRLPVRSKPRKVVSSDGTVITGQGRHVLVCDGCVLIDEEWDHPTFPFVVFRWATDPERFWGQGMVERAAGMQSDLNEFTEITQTSYKTFVPQAWIDDTAGVQDINDVIGRVNRCSPPSGNVRDAVAFISPEVAPGLLSREEVIAGRFLPSLGVDALAAQAEKPPGLNSGTALQNYKDSVSARFLPQGRRYDESTVALANLLFYFADKLAAAGHPQTVRVFGDTIGLELIEHDQIKPQEGEVFDVRVMPASALPKDIAGKIQVLFDVQALGVPIDPAKMAQMIEMPDIEALVDEMNAGIMLVGRAIDECYNEDGYQPQANAFWPQQAALQMLTRRIQLGEYKGVAPAVLDRMRNLHTFVRGMPDPNAPAPAPTQPTATGSPMMGGATGAAPGPMPAAPPPEAMGQPAPPMM